MNRRHFLSAVTMGTLVAPYLARADQAKPVLIQRTLDAPPRCVYLGDGKWSGFEVELSRILCDRVGAELQPINEYLVWARALKMIETGDIQLLPNVTWRPERTSVMDYIGPCAVLKRYVVVRRENADTRFDSLDDFAVADRMFEVTAGSAISPEFDKRIATDPAFAAHFISAVSGASLQQMQHVEALASRVAAGRVFGAITDSFSYQALLRMDPADLNFDPNDLVGVPATLFAPETNYICASLHVDAGLRENLHTAYRESRRDGSFDDIWREWYPDTSLPPIE